MTKSFENYLIVKFSLSKEYTQELFIRWFYHLTCEEIINYADQYAKESAPVKADLDKDIHITNGIDKKHHIVREFKERIYNETDNPIDPAQARKSLDCLTRYREALEELLDAYGHYNIKVDGKEYKATLKAKQALKEESERL